MRTRTLLSITLLGLLLWASCAQADDTDETQDKQAEETSEETSEETAEDTSAETAAEEEEDDDADEPKKEKTTEIEEERDVMVLHINNFDRALSENQYVLVEFCK